jgi:hypothetical protein
MKTPSQFLNTTIGSTGSIAVEYYFSKESDTQPGVVDLHCTFRDESKSATISLKERVNRKAVSDGPATAQVIGEMLSEYFAGEVSSGPAIHPTV